MAPRTRSFRQNCLFDDAVASNVAQYLDIKSLVHFCTSNRRMTTQSAVMDIEVARRKAVFSENHKTVEKLMAGQHPSRENILQATELHENSCRLIELYGGEIQERSRSVSARGGSNVVIRKDPLFQWERDLLASSFRVLPICFYAPTSGREWLQPTEAMISFAKNHAGFFWQAQERKMKEFYDMISSSSSQDDHLYYNDPQFPFRKFEHTLALPFTDYYMRPFIAFLKTDMPKVDAFRIAARELATRIPDATDVLYFMLYHCDIQEEDGEEEEEEVMEAIVLTTQEEVMDDDDAAMVDAAAATAQEDHDEDSEMSD